MTQAYQVTLAADIGLCYSSRPVFAEHENANGIRWLSWQALKKACSAENEGVDEKRETRHNLIPLLLTNKTIRRTQQSSTEHSSLTINSR
jgi:hypothetical protein